MSAAFVTAVFEKSPKHVRGADLLVMMKLAEDIMSENGFGITHVLRTADYIHESEDRVNKSLAYLHQNGLIEIIEDERPNSPWKYPYVNYRFTDPEDWA